MIRLDDRYDSALIGGVACWVDQSSVVVPCYDIDLISQILVEQDGMAPEEADDYISFNLIGAYVDPMQPVFLIRGEDGILAARDSMDEGAA